MRSGAMDDEQVELSQAERGSRDVIVRATFSPKMATRQTSGLLTLVLSLAAPAAESLAAQRPATSGAPLIAIDASRFLDEIQKGHVITDAAALRVQWVFN